MPQKFPICLNGCLTGPDLAVLAQAEKDPGTGNIRK